MANVIYEVMAPDGQTILEIEGPEGAAPEQVKAAAARLYRQQLEAQAATTDVPVIDEMGRVVQTPAAAPAPAPTMGERAVGAAEALATMATGAPAFAAQVGGTLGATAASILRGEFGTPEAAQMIQETAMEQAARPLYVPRTQAGQQAVQAIGQAAEVIPPFVPMAAELGMAGRMAGAAGRQAGVAGREAAGRAATAAVEEARALGRDVTEVGRGIQELGEMGRRAITPAETPQGRAAGAAETPAALQRIATAEGLPVPVKLTLGAATRDEDQITFERAQMKQILGGSLRDRADENNLQILQNFDAFIDMAGEKAASVVASGPGDVGRTVVDALKLGLKKQKNKVNVAYQKARASGETKEPVDIDNLINYINDSQSEQATAPIVKTLREIMIRDKLATVGRNGNLVPMPRIGVDPIMNNPGTSRITIDDLERFRQAVNKNVGNERTDIRQATIIKSIIDGITEGKGGQLYKEARKLREEQAKVFENRAVVARLVENINNMDDPKVAAERVFDKSIKNASLDEIQFLKDTLNTKAGKKGKQAWKNIEAATVDYIRNNSLTTATNAQDQRIVSPAALTKTVEQLDANGRLETIFGKTRAQQMRDLAEVSRYVATAPPGAIINTSDSANLILAALAETGAGLATVGIPAPIFTIIKASKNWKDKQALRNRINEALRSRTD